MVNQMGLRIFFKSFSSCYSTILRYLYTVYTLFLSHGFSPDLMILGTNIPIPKNRKNRYVTVATFGLLF